VDFRIFTTIIIDELVTILKVILVCHFERSEKYCMGY